MQADAHASPVGDVIDVKIVASRPDQRTGRRALGPSGDHSGPEHVEAGEDRPAVGHGRPVPRRGRPGQQGRDRAGDRGFRRLRARPADRGPAGGRPGQAGCVHLAGAANGSTTPGVDVLADGAASSSGLAIQQVCREKKRIYLITGPATSDMTGKQCSPYGIHFSYDTYALAHGTGNALTKAGGDTWFFITADYAFGYALERDTMSAVKAAGGKVLGAVRAPLATADFSSYLVQAQASGAKVIGLANAGTDTQNCVKQAAEFGLTKSGVRLATLLIQISDVNALGQKVCEGLTYTDSFYWDMTDKTRAWSKRWSDRMGGMVPGLLHAGSYCAAYHWLKAVKAAGTTDADAVVAKMKATPVNDFYNDNVKIREDGRVMHVMYLWQVKPVAQARSKYRFLQQAGDDFAGGCLASAGIGGMPADQDVACTRRVERTPRHGF